MNKKKIWSAVSDAGSAAVSVGKRIAGLPRLASFGLHVLLLSWILFNNSARWAHIDWADVIPGLVLGFLAFKRAS